MDNQESTETLSTDSIEVLRKILETKQKRSISYDEALEVGESLINFFEVLAGAV